MSDIFGSLAPETDALVPPPRNPAAPPDMIANAVRAALQHNLDWAKLPGRVMQGVQPSTPGQWSEEDEYRAQDLARRAYDWGSQTAFSDVFWPRSGGAGTLTSGAGSKMTQPQKAATPTEQHVANLTTAGTNNQEAFDLALNAIKADPSLKTADMVAIANSYGYGGTPYKKTKEGALEHIKSNWVQASRFENKLKSVR